jgi:hypothetical protein
VRDLKLKMIAYIGRGVVKKMTLKAVLPRLLMISGIVSFMVYLELGTDGQRLNYSHSAYVAKGIAIGLYAAGIVSWLVLWLLDDRKREPHG